MGMDRYTSLFLYSSMFLLLQFSDTISMNHNNQTYWTNHISFKEGIMEIEEEKKEFLSLFDQLLFQSQNHDASSLSEFYYHIPQVYIRQEENSINLEMDVFQEKQQQAIEKHQQTKREQQKTQDDKKQQIAVVKKKCTCQCSRCQTNACPCFRTQKLKCFFKCTCIGKCKLKIKSIKRGVLKPFWSLNDLV